MQPYLLTFIYTLFIGFSEPDERLTCLLELSFTIMKFLSLAPYLETYFRW